MQTRGNFLILVFLISLSTQAQLVVPRKIQEFSQYFNLTPDGVARKMAKAGFTEFDLDRAEATGNYEYLTYYSPDEDSEDGLEVLYFEGISAGVLNQNMSLQDYYAFIKELQSNGFVQTHQWIQSRGNENWRSDIWHNKDSKLKAYINYYIGETLDRPIAAGIAKSKVLDEARESKTTSILPWVEPVNYATLYADRNFGGGSMQLKAGKRLKLIASGKTRGQGCTLCNDDISSLKVPFGAVAEVYTDADFSGDSEEFRGNVAFVGSALNDRVSSISIYQSVVKLCSMTGFIGECLSGRAGARETELIDDVSSIRVDEGLQVIIFDEENFKGNSRVITGSVNDLGSWKGKVKSYMVELVPSANTGTSTSKNDIIASHAESLMDFIENKIGKVYPPGGDIYENKDQQKVFQYITIDPDTYHIKLEKFRLPVDCSKGTSSINVNEVVTFNLGDIDEVYSIELKGSKGSVFTVGFRVKDYSSKVARKYRLIGTTVKKTCTWEDSNWNSSITTNNYVTRFDNGVFAFEFTSQNDANKVLTSLQEIIKLIKN